MIRARDWAHFLPLPLLTLPRDAFGDWPTALPWLAGMISAAACLGFAYALNEFEDEVVPRSCSDGVRPRLPRALKAVLVFLVVLALASASFNGVRALAAALVAVVAGALYSGGPRLKAKPLVGTVMNAAIFAPLLLIGPSAAPLLAEHAVLVVAFCAVLLQNQIIHEAAHAEDDTKDGIRTSWLTFGPTVSALGAGLLGVVAVACLVGAAPGVVTAAASLPLLGVTVAARPAQLREPATAKRLRVLHRYAGALSGAVAWLCIS